MRASPRTAGPKLCHQALLECHDVLTEPDLATAFSAENNSAPLQGFCIIEWLGKFLIHKSGSGRLLEPQGFCDACRHDAFRLGWNIEGSL